MIAIALSLAAASAAYTGRLIATDGFSRIPTR